MRCKYCFQAIPDQSARCPQCGSRLVEGSLAAVAGNAAATPSGSTRTKRRPLTAKQSRRMTIIAALAVAAFLCILVILIFPSLLPAPVIAALNLGTPIPTATFQATRATIFTPTPPIWRSFSNRQAGFNFDLPAGWLVVNQANTGWQDTVEETAADYPWAETLFETGTVPNEPRSRAVDPAAIDMDNGKVVVFTAGLAPLESGTTFSQIEEIARSQPATLAELAGGLVGTNFTAARSERLAVNGRDALLVEFTAQPDFFGQVIRVRVRLYFVPVGDELFLITYFAEEQLANQNRALYDQIVQSFEPTE
jgi:hypothetical protein